MKFLMVMAVLAFTASIAVGWNAAPASAGATVTPSAASYWTTTLPATAMPATVQRLLSPLSAADASKYAKLIAQGRMLADPALASEFCTAAGMACASVPAVGAKQGGGSCTRFLYDYGICTEPASVAPTQEQKNTWFFQSDLTSLAVPASLLGESTSALQRSFLPRALVEALGRKTSAAGGRKDLAWPASASVDVDGVFRQLHIAPGSDVAMESRSDADDYCNRTSKEGACVQSVEELADLLASRFHVGVEGVETVAGSSTFPEFFSDESVAAGDLAVVKVELKAGTSDRFLTCHSVVFPYEVLFCHFVPESKLYLVTLESTAKKGVEVVNVVHCHMDTSRWNANHVSFRVLGTRPGSKHACHWSPLDTVVFLPRTTA